MMDFKIPCPICSTSTVSAGTKQRTRAHDPYRFRFCPACHFRYAENPLSDYESVLAKNNDAAQYRARVNQKDILNSPGDQSEWRGQLQTLQSLTPLNAQTQWLDYRCNTGGFVRYVKARSAVRPTCFEEGWKADAALKAGTPLLTQTELAGYKGAFDVVTALNVLQTIREPLKFLRDLRSLLKPGGLLFLTTENAEPYGNHFLKWHYVEPDEYVSFFEPRTLKLALELSGFSAEFRGRLPGFDDIVRTKVLQKFGVRNSLFYGKFFPWPKVINRVADRFYKFSAFPIGWAV